MHYNMVKWAATIAIIGCLGCNRSTPSLTPALTDAATIAKNLDSPPAKPQPDNDLEHSQAKADPEVEEEPSPDANTSSQPLVTEVVSLTAGPLVEPHVILSDSHKATCRLLVGSSIADTNVTDASGTDHQLFRLLGDQLTVMIFWSEQSASSLEQLRRISIDIPADFAPAVKVVTVNVGSELSAAKDLTGDAAEQIVSLVDHEGALFHQFATELLPRTYIIDHQGKILWFDIEYSQSTQRTLRSALAYFLRNS